MISGFWNELNEADSDSAVEDVTRLTGEVFEDDKVVARKFFANLYQGWNIYRLRFAKQRTFNQNDPTRRKDIPEGGFCIVLLNEAATEVICMKNNSPFLYAVNAKLGIDVTPKNLIPYLTFFGQVVHASDGPFHFISDLSQVTDSDSLTPEVADRVENAVKTLFNADSEGALQLNTKSRSLPILGSVHTVELPCIHAGGVYKSSLKVSSQGYPEMTGDDELTVRDLRELNPVRFYYHVDNPPKTIQGLLAAEKKMKRGENRLALPMILEKIFGALAFPIFGIFALLLWRFGASDDVMSAFFAQLPELGILNWTCLLLGGCIVVGSLMRFLFFEVVRLSAKLVPNRYSMALSHAEAVLRLTRQKFGLLGFVLVFLIEFVLIPVMGAVLLAYGALNVLSDRLWSFVDTTSLVLSSFPVLPYIGKWAFGIEAFDRTDYDTFSTAMAWGFSLFFGTIVIGVVSRVLIILLFRSRE